LASTSRSNMKISLTPSEGVTVTLPDIRTSPASGAA
jgi:hypothetical protein